MPEDKKTCFIIMPITTPADMIETYRDGKDHFTHVLECLFVPGVEKAGFDPIRPIAKGADLIHAGIVENLETADMVLCDMSTLNANVFFEFGIRTSLNKPVCVVKDDLTKRVPFDVGVLNYHEYLSSLGMESGPNQIERLAVHIRESSERSDGQNTLWKYFGMKSEAVPYEGKKGEEGKLDYLSTQVDAMRQKLDSLKPSSLSDDLGQHLPYGTVAIDPDDVQEALSSLPRRSIEHWTLHNEPGGCVISYRGRLPSDQEARIGAVVSAKIGVPVVLKRLPDAASAQA